MKVDLQHLPKARLDFVKPMLAKPVNHLPAGGDWLYEVKLDGYRALVLKKRRVVTTSKVSSQNVPIAGMKAASAAVRGPSTRQTKARNS